MVLRIDAASLCEYLAFWGGGTTLTEVGRLLGYTSRQVHTLVSDGFARRGRATARYDFRTKRWHPTVASRRLHGPRSAHDATTILQALHLWSQGSDAEGLFPVEDTRALRPGPAPDTFRILLGACMRRKVVDVVYKARTREHAISFSPHTLVVAPHRSHFRGYSTFEFDGESHYWDLVPGRVLSAELRPGLGYVDARDDAEWHATVVLRLTLRKDLPNAMREALRYEHDTVDDRIEVGPLRKALLPYVRSEYLGRRYEGFHGAVWDVAEDAV